MASLRAMLDGGWRYFARALVDVVAERWRDERVAGAAAAPRVTFRPNPPGTPRRTLDEALAIARNEGVDVDDDELRFVRAPRPLGDGRLAYYFALQVQRSEGRTLVIELDKLRTPDKKVCVIVSPDTLDSDDAIVAALAHEVHEITALLAEFAANGGRLTAERLHFLVNENTGTLHCAAWDYADDLVRKRQARR